MQQDANAIASMGSGGVLGVGGPGVCSPANGGGAVGILCALDGVETTEWFAEVVVGDLLVVDVEGVEDGLVEHLALFVVASAILLLGIFE
ncbi:hypothetical protein [Nocardia sp. NBC_00403]|uniref:hypothetical protein n=1 Tax=Nocardia sp. NBC_00403 TaxID=2975990 RepID=UPI002E1AA9A5